MPNFIQNPSFEMGLINWNHVNVEIASEDALEGSSTARLGPGVASLFQDVNISRFRRPSFRLSFGVAAPDSDPGNLTVAVQWLDQCKRLIGTGLAMFIPSETIFEQNGWLTISNVTEVAPANAVFARVVFNKTSINNTSDLLDLDLVVLDL